MRRIVAGEPVGAAPVRWAAGGPRRARFVARGRAVAAAAGAHGGVLTLDPASHPIGAHARRFAARSGQGPPPSTSGRPHGGGSTPQLEVASPRSPCACDDSISNG